jgi:hypothetical protein
MSASCELRADTASEVLKLRCWLCRVELCPICAPPHMSRELASDAASSLKHCALKAVHTAVRDTLIRESKVQPAAILRTSLAHCEGVAVVHDGLSCASQRRLLWSPKDGT